MKRIVAVILLLCIGLSGCKVLEARIKDPVTFYYLQKEYSYGGTGSILAPEIRETYGEHRDLTYLLALYLVGPNDEEHTMPLPSGTKITSTVQENGTIVLTLSDVAQGMSEAELTLACACLSRTCFDFTDAKKVTVQLGERSISMTRSNLLLSDDNVNKAIMEEKE